MQKYACELVAGERIYVTTPQALAEVTKAYQSKSTPIEKDGFKAVAWIIAFKILEGPRRGTEGHTFQHPKDRIRIA